MAKYLTVGIAVAWLMSGNCIAQSDDSNETAAADADTVTADSEAALTRAERRELRRAEQEAAAEVDRVAESQTGAEEGDNDEGLICRRESVVGTHRRVRICTTRAQREAMRESSRELILDITRPRGALGPEGQ